MGRAVRQERPQNPKSLASSLPIAIAAVLATSLPLMFYREARRQHLGSMLLSAGEGRLRLAGCTLVTLETAVDNASAINFYRRPPVHVEAHHPPLLPERS